MFIIDLSLYTKTLYKVFFSYMLEFQFEIYAAAAVTILGSEI